MRILINLFSTFIICSCNIICPDWSEEKKQQFAVECSEKSTIDYLIIQYHDFSFDEIDTVWILEQSKGVLIDSFQLITNRLEDSSQAYFSTTISSNINVQNTFTIKIQNEIFSIEGFGFEVGPEYTMCSKSYGCHLASYTIGGNVFGYNGSIVLVRGADR